MKNLRLFETKAEYNSAKDDIVKPYIAYTKEGKTICVGDEKKVTLVDYVYLSYGYSLDEWNDGTRLDYVDEYEYEGKTYSRFAYSYINEESGERETVGFDDWGFVLFENRNFTKLSLFPYSMEVLQGYIYDEGEADIYPFVNEYSNVELYGFAEEQTNMIVMQHRTDIGTNANGHSYIDLGLTSGTLWATTNVGAESETEYGGYFQWGDTEDKSDAVCNWETYKYSNDDGTEFSKYNTDLNVGGTIDNKITLDLEDDAARANMGGDWKMPSLALMQELVLETDNEWVTDYQGSGVNGRLFVSKTNGNSIFIPASGFRWDSSFSDQGIDACVWSSSLFTSSPFGAMYLYFGSDRINTYYGYNRYDGFVVRGIL